MDTAAPGTPLRVRTGVPGWLVRSLVLVLSIDLHADTTQWRMACLVTMMSFMHALRVVGGGVTARTYAGCLPRSFRRQGRPREGRYLRIHGLGCTLDCLR